MIRDLVWAGISFGMFLTGLFFGLWVRRAPCCPSKPLNPDDVDTLDSVDADALREATCTRV